MLEFFKQNPRYVERRLYPALALYGNGRRHGGIRGISGLPRGLGGRKSRVIMEGYVKVKSRVHKILFVFVGITLEKREAEIFFKRFFGSVHHRNPVYLGNLSLGVHERGAATVLHGLPRILGPDLAQERFYLLVIRRHGLDLRRV